MTNMEKLDNQESPSKELEHKGGLSLKERKTNYTASIFSRELELNGLGWVNSFIEDLWEENQHAKRWIKENIKEESEWATKYMQTKEQLTATQQALASAAEALKECLGDYKIAYDAMMSKHLMQPTYMHQMSRNISLEQAGLRIQVIQAAIEAALASIKE